METDHKDRVISALKTQRNAALDALANQTAQMESIITALQAKISDLEGKVKIMCPVDKATGPLG